MGVISVASGWSIDGHQAAGRQEEAMLEAVVRDGVAEALLVATTGETRRGGQQHALCSLARQAPAD